MKSQLADDPIVSPLLPGYLKNLVQIVLEMRAASELADTHEVSRVAHMVKGSSACYGYPTISAKAGEIERAASGKAQTKDLIGLVSSLSSLVDAASSTSVG